MTSLQRIMHVDDDVTILQVTEIALQSVAKLEIRTCDSGQKAIAQITSFKPQLIILDVQMPELDGRETLKKLKEVVALDNIAVVFMTASNNPSEAKSLRELGAFDVIQKPFDPMQLPARVREIWLAWKTKHGWQ